MEGFVTEILYAQFILGERLTRKMCRRGHSPQPLSRGEPRRLPAVIGK